jgi:hypothetical protein
MKKLLFLLFIASMFQVNAQTVNGIKLEDIPAKYVEIVSAYKDFKPFQITVYLDYGQMSSMKEINKGYIIGTDGNSMVFNGTIGVLNTLEKKGFKYLHQYLFNLGSKDVYHTLLENTNYKE